MVFLCSALRRSGVGSTLSHLLRGQCGQLLGCLLGAAVNWRFALCTISGCRAEDVSLPPPVVAFKGCAPLNPQPVARLPQPPLLAWWRRRAPTSKHSPPHYLALEKSNVVWLVFVCFLVPPLITQQEEKGRINKTLRNCFPLTSRPFNPHPTFI